MLITKGKCYLLEKKTTFSEDNKVSFAYRADPDQRDPTNARKLQGTK